MPLRKIVTKAGKAVMTTLEGKKSGEKYAAAAAKKAVAATAKETAIVQLSSGNPTCVFGTFNLSD